MNAIYAMWLREVKRYLRSRVQIIASLAQPMMYLLILGFGLGPVFANGLARTRRRRSLCTQRHSFSHCSSVAAEFAESTYSAMPSTARSTLANVKSSAMMARQPEVPMRPPPSGRYRPPPRPA